MKTMFSTAILFLLTNIAQAQVDTTTYPKERLEIK